MVWCTSLHHYCIDYLRCQGLHQSPSDPLSILKAVAENTTNRSFVDELPKLLEKNGMTLRSLAREVGGLDHAYLSRMLSGKAQVNPGHAERVSRFLGLPLDYFPEVREARVVSAVRRSARLRDEIYFDRIRRR